MASCGCYVHYKDPKGRQMLRCLPLVETVIHSTILHTAFSTSLKQTFINHSKQLVEECIYQFPLYDGVSVVKFVCKVDNRIIHGIVQEKVKARETFDKAVAKGQTAALLERNSYAADVFSTSIGNIPPGEEVEIEITYVGELQHDAQADGIRFTIPTKVAPRYGPSHQYDTISDSSALLAKQGKLKITVDANMAENVTSIESPSHQIAVKPGVLSTALNELPTMTKASATLSLEDAVLHHDFILIVASKAVDRPRAILETHSTIEYHPHRALMVTLVPKFTLPPFRPEIVFLVDRSGSMCGKVPALVSAMKVFLRSLPTGIKFNICSFGSSHEFLWPKSRSYCKKSLSEAALYVDGFNADMGGTEILEAIAATCKGKSKEMPGLEIILLTDGDIWHQKDLFDFLNKEVAESKGKTRVHPLGIGTGASSSLIQGVARAGNGFALHTSDSERIDKSVVRMLKCALFPHVTDYTLEVKYDESEDYHELIEKVTECLEDVLLEGKEEEAVSENGKENAQISLWKPNSDTDTDSTLDHPTVDLPTITYPMLLQAPFIIPSLYPFQRTVVYLLMSSATSERNPSSVILRGTAPTGPLVLEIPIEILDEQSDTIHQLAALKAAQEMEEGRGWIYHAKDGEDKLIKDRYASDFKDLIQAEAVRLGDEFQVVNKWCSFVAVKENNEHSDNEVNIHLGSTSTRGGLASSSGRGRHAFRGAGSGRGGGRGGGLGGRDGGTGMMLCSFGGNGADDEETKGIDDSSDEDQGFGLFDDGPSHSSDEDQGFGLFDDGPSHSATQPVHKIIDLQDFAGFWTTNAANALSSAMSIDVKKIVSPIGWTNLELTLFVVCWLEKEMAAEKEVWELVVDKAREWMVGNCGGNRKVDKLEVRVKATLK